MTENEIKNAIEVFEKPSKHIKCVHKCENGMEFLTYSQYLVLAFETAIDCLEEIQQYRAIGTVEECWEARERQRGKKPEWSPDCEECEKDGTLDCTYKCGSFSTLSSVLVCPNCKKQRVIKEHGHRYCHNCGQAIDWSDTP